MSSSEGGREMSRCPDCESDLELDGYEVEAGETMHCPECSTELVVVSTDPIVLRSPDEE
jgi:alpha-aminoadipate/glutamate carrier protein LysW